MAADLIKELESIEKNIRRKSILSLGLILAAAAGFAALMYHFSGNDDWIFMQVYGKDFLQTCNYQLTSGGKFSGRTTELTASVNESENAEASVRITNNGNIPMTVYPSDFSFRIYDGSEYQSMNAENFSPITLKPGQSADLAVRADTPADLQFGDNSITELCYNSPINSEKASFMLIFN
ncbi:MAG: hypothetical protein ACI4SF_06145 [Oscillospiraceae bacterium]